MALDAGMNDHISKPLNIDDLFGTLSRWIRPQGGVGTPAAQETAADSVESLPGVDAATLASAPPLGDACRASGPPPVASLPRTQDAGVGRDG